MNGRPVDSTRATCSNCGETLQPGNRFCGSCGAVAVNCSRCGGRLSAVDRFCGHCGNATGSASADELARDPESPAGPEDPWSLIVQRLRTAIQGEFDILRELGRGGMAAVYLAHEVALNRKVAIKLMSPALLTGEGMVKRFRQEAVTVANMSHPHIVTIHAVRQIEDLHFFVMKFVEGRSLEHIIRSAGALPVATVRGLLWMVGNALAYAHRRGVVHRDIKPANIILDEDGCAVVTDFGIAKLVTGDFGVPRTSLGHTATGMLIGTPTYMSPEQCLASAISAASDQYSLGLVAYELLTGHPPFTGSPFAVMHAHTERQPPAIREQRPDCPEDLEAAVLRMLEKEPEKRWPTMQHALAALRAAPLADDDPARAELAQLSLPTSFRRSDEVLSFPSSMASGEISSASVTPRPYVAAVEIFAPPESIEVGDSFMLTASPRNPTGDTMPGVRVRWTSAEPEVATVDAVHGVVQAIAPGAVDITATAAGVHNAVTVTVIPRRVAAVNISLPPGAIHAGDRVQLGAAAEDKRHEAVARGIRWESADESLAVVDGDGILHAKAPGLVLVWAESDGVRGQARLEIAPAPVAALHLIAPPLVEVGETVSVSAQALDARGVILPGRAVTWSTNDASILEVSGDGVLRACKAGTVRLTGTSEGKSAFTELRVAEPLVATVAISSPPQDVNIGVPFTLHARPASARGLRMDRPVEWFSETPALASVNAAGVVIPKTPGDARIAVVCDGVEESITFSVNVPPTLVTAKLPEETGLVEALQRLGIERPKLEEAVPVVAAVESVPLPPLPEWTKDEAGVGAARISGEVAGADGEEQQNAEAEEPPSSAEPQPEDALAAPARSSWRSSLRNRPALIGALAILVSVLALSFARLGRGGEQPAAAIVAPADSTRGPDAVALAGAGGTQLDSAAGVIEAGRTADSAARASTLPPVTTGVLTVDVSRPKPLHVGDSVTLRGTAKWPDGTGTPLKWTSSADSVARIDEKTGTVIGIGEGTAVITAQAGTSSKQVSLTVLPSPVTAPVASSDSYGAPSQPADVAQLLTARVQDFVRAVADHDLVRVSALYGAESAEDKKNLASLVDLLRRPASKLKLSAPQIGMPVIRDNEATIDFIARMSWTTPTGAAREPSVAFRVHFGRAVDGWRLAGVRMLNALE